MGWYGMNLLEREGQLVLALGVIELLLDGRCPKCGGPTSCGLSDYPDGWKCVGCEFTMKATDVHEWVESTKRDLRGETGE